MPNIRKTDAVKSPSGAKLYGHDAGGNVGQFDAGAFMPAIATDSAIKSPVAASVFGRNSLGELGRFNANDLDINNFRKIPA